MKLYALHDKKANALTNFHVERGDAVASRAFAAAVGQPESVLARYPDDFELVALMEIDDVASQWDYMAGADVRLKAMFEVVVTARQVVDLARPVGEQLSLLKEA